MDARKAKRLGALTAAVAAAALGVGMSAVSANAATPATTPAHSHLHGVIPTVQAAQHARAIQPLSTKTLQYGGGVDGIGVTTGNKRRQPYHRRVA